MKRIFTLCIFLFVFTAQSFAQSYVNYDRDSRWYIGLNSGVVWTSQTEMDWRLRGGYGLVLGHSFNKEPGKVFSWDLRGRFLHAWAVGQDTRRYLVDSTSTSIDYLGDNVQGYKDEYGFFVANHRTQLLRGSLELTLNTNRLRERTGINMYLLGGIGITGYHTSMDLLDNTSLYNYGSSTFTSNPSQTNYILSRDRDYETDVAGTASEYKVDWMPSFGAGIEYQFAPYFAMGLEYKQTWTRNNDFDGMLNNLDGSASTTNDMYHYFSGTMKFQLWGGSSTVDNDPEPVTDVNNFDNTDTNPVVDPVVTPPPPVQKPIVDITNPNASPHTTSSEFFNLTANVHYVDGKGNITFKQNGVINNNFSYNANSDAFASNVVLQPGQNLFEITATNDAGMDYETTIIIYEKEEVVVPNPPIVTITNPPYSPYTSNNNVFAFSATVLNVDSKADIQVFFNGVNIPHFSYNVTTDVLNTTLTLMEGMNTFTVTATNADGSDSKTAQVIYTKPPVEQPPVVNYIYPAVDPFTTAVNNINITASVLNVHAKGNITVSINGVPTTAFNYNSSSKQVTFNTPLIEGANLINIKGVNSVGFDEESTTIIYRKPETPQPPVVTFINPNIGLTTVYESTYVVTAKVLHVASAADITLKINGVESTFFTYSTSSKLMNFTTHLVEGSNIIEIKGTNIHGEDIESTTIIYKKPKPATPPLVEITYPVSNYQTFWSPNLNLIASVLNVETYHDISVLINGTSTNDFTFNPVTKVVTVPLVLVEGNNSITITGTNLSGTDSDTRIIVYKKKHLPKPPMVEWINPASTPYEVTVSNYILTASTTNILNKDEITLKMNGVLVPDAAYTFNHSNQIIYEADLMAGNNVFEVTVTNVDGTANDVTVINYIPNTEPCIIPTIGYVSPVPFSTVEEASINIDAQINNYSTGTTIELLLNGVSNGYMSFNPSTSIASKGVTLNEGSNAVTVIVTNDCGTNRSNFTLNYVLPETPCSAPEVTAISPLVFTTDAETTNINAVLANVESADNISVMNNGSAVAFTYDAASGSVSIPTIGLTVGTNALKIRAANECGMDEIIYTITREVCETPVIKNLMPLTGTAFEVNTVPVSVTVLNAHASEITLVVNGISQPFSFNEATKLLTATASLNIGDNTISVSVTTPCGTANSSVTVSRQEPCSEITTNLISPATNTITVTNSAYAVTLHTTHVVAAADVSAKLNGTAVPAAFDPVTGNVTITGITLNDGANTVQISLKNECSEKLIDYTINYDGCKPAVINMPGLTSGMSVDNLAMEIAGTITNVNAISEIEFTVNGAPADFDFELATGNFNANIALVEGANTVMIVVNGCKKVSKSYTINAKIPCETIVTAPMSPTMSTVTTTEPVYSISFTATGITSESEVTTLHNGTPVGFTLNTATHVITIPVINLVEGSNVVNIILKNACSTAELQYSINYNGCQAPVITIGSHSDETAEAGYDFTATVTNIESGHDLAVTLNGAPITVLYNAATQTLSGSVTLSEGANTIQITANGCETATSSFNVTYNSPCDEVTYALFRPATTELSSASPTTNLMLNAFNITTEGISVTINGEPAEFTFAGNRINITADLTSGANAVVVTMTNGCSKETVTYSIDYADCESPTISMTDAHSSSETSTYSFSGIVTGVDAASNITVKLNGGVQAFEFNSATGALSSTVNLNEGLNEIRITANGCDVFEHYFNVLFEAPCSPVTYTLTSPSSMSAVVEDDLTNISLLVTNVSSSDDITVTFNGTPAPFAFTVGNIDINGLALVEGENTVVVNVSNACSAETLTYTITKPPCASPSIVLNNTSTSVSTTTFNLSSTILNVGSADDLTLTMGGASLPFKFNPATHELTATLTLVEGDNAVTITANGCMTSAATFTLEYHPPCSEVSYSYITPNTTTVTTTEPTYTVKLSASNVITSNISVTLNGSSVPFSFFAGKITVSGLALTPGKNTVDVSMVNDCSSETVTYTINYDYTPDPCGPRIDMGGAASDFCLITPSGTYNKDYLVANPSFTYNGPAHVIYFTASSGGGDADVGGAPYAVGAGKTYFFSGGTLNVNLNKNHPGSPGQWSVCINASMEPQWGIGESRPVSPCSSSGTSTTGGGGTPTIGDGTTSSESSVAPVVSPISPAGSSANVRTATYMYKVKVENVTSKANIKVFVNNIAFTGFTYSSMSKEVVAVVRLKSGNNTIRVEATNGDKKTTYQTTINYKAQSINTGRNTGTNAGSKNTGGTNTGSKNTGSGGTSTNSGARTTNTGNSGTNSGSKSTNTGGTKTTTTGGGTKTTTTGGGTRTTNTNNTGTKNTNTGGNKTTGGGTKTTTTGGGTRTTNTNNTGTKNTNTGGTKTTGSGTKTTTTGGGTRSTNTNNSGNRTTNGGGI